jgi:hypothetical protein
MQATALLFRGRLPMQQVAVLQMDGLEEKVLQDLKIPVRLIHQPPLLLIAQVSEEMQTLRLWLILILPSISVLTYQAINRVFQAA